MELEAGVTGGAAGLANGSPVICGGFQGQGQGFQFKRECYRYGTFRNPSMLPCHLYEILSWY